MNDMNTFLDNLILELRRITMSVDLLKLDPSLLSCSEYLYKYRSELDSAFIKTITAFNPDNASEN